MASYSGITSFYLLLLISILDSAVRSEPVCSKFVYEEQLLGKMIRMEFKVETMVNDIKTTQSDVREELKSIRENVKHDLDLIKQERQAMKTELALLKDKMTKEITLQASKAKETFQQQDATMSRMSEDLLHLKNTTVQELKDLTVTPTVAFKSRFVEDTSPATNQIIVFKTNLLNEGQGYNNDTGVFTAPVDGVYLFTVQFCTKTGINYMYFDIVVENESQTVGTMYDGDSVVCHSTDAVAIMKTGMRAWVKCSSGYSAAFLHTDSHRWNTFSGVLINKM